MSLASKILLGFIAVAALAFFYLAAWTLRTHENWRSVAQRNEGQIEQFTQQNADLISGGNQPEQGIRAMRTRLHALVVGRGRVWYGAIPGRADAATGSVSVTIENPSPHGIGVNEVLYVFESAAIGADAAGRYLGQFRTSNADDTGVTLDPALGMSSTELERLAASRGPWTLYEIMPTDGHDVFAGVEEAQLRELLPDAALEPYLRDGQPSAADDPPERVFNGKFERKLRDYAQLFRGYHLGRTELADRIAEINRDKQAMDQAVADANRQIEFRRQEISALTDQNALAGRELAAVEKHRSDVSQRLRQSRMAIDAAMAENRRLVKRLTALEQRLLRSAGATSQTASLATGD